MVVVWRFVCFVFIFICFYHSYEGDMVGFAAVVNWVYVVVICGCVIFIVVFVDVVVGGAVIGRVVVRSFHQVVVVLVLVVIYDPETVAPSKSQPAD